MIPSLLPVFDGQRWVLDDGSEVPSCSFCRSAFIERPQCKKHYTTLTTRAEGYYQCPFGFTTRSFFLDGRLYAITGTVAYPRFGTAREREMAKKYPKNRSSRETIERGVTYLRELDLLRADRIQEGAKVLPQAFHELRKLNAAVLQHAEREISNSGESPSLISIRSAAELMRNNFEILEALANIDTMRSLPIDSTISLYDLLYKTKKVFHERAGRKQMQVAVSGARAIIRGSQKSFPIVPAVLLENAIKYGLRSSTIGMHVETIGSKVFCTIENRSASPIDPDRCFARGARFSEDAEGSGFGLFLAREIVHCHRGTIRCQSAGGVVRMVLELPLVKVLPGY